MKRLITLILVAALSFSLCACGASAPSVGDQMYEKYGSIINNLEAEEYQKVIDEVTAMMPVPEEKTVPINLGNFNEYYELRYDETQVNRDSQGKAVSAWVTNAFYYGLKEEYLEKLVGDSSSVEIGVTADCVLKKVENINWETGEVTLATDSYNDILKDILKTYRDMPVNISTTQSGNVVLYGGDMSPLSYGIFYLRQESWGTAWSSGELKAGETGTDYYVFVPENINVVRAEGTLTLKG